MIPQFRVSVPDKNSPMVAGIRELARAIAHPSELLRTWGPKLVQWQQENIQRGIAPHFGPPSRQGEPFQPLSPEYIKQRTRYALRKTALGAGPHFGQGTHARATVGRTAHPFGVKPLLDTTAMFATMGWKIERSSVVGGATVTTKDGFNYAEAHQLGRGVGVRPWSGLRRDNVAEERQDLAEWVSRRLREAFR